MRHSDIFELLSVNLAAKIPKYHQADISDASASTDWFRTRSRSDLNTSKITVTF